MTRILTIISFLFSFGLFVEAQHSIQSSVFDSANGQILEMATVRLLNQKDSVLVQGVQTDMKGRFMLSKVKEGNYILRISSVGYYDYFKDISMENKDIILKNIQLKEDPKLLSELEVKGTAAQLVVKGDTIEYNSAAFKTTENAVVEELLKKLPGVEVSTEGKITVNGEEIKKIRVDGKKFFDGDIEQATKNLPADMIDKIQVLDQKSDMALLTGFEDEDTERIINLTTKVNRRKGVFGNVGAGLGFDINKDLRYDSRLSVNIMSGESQTSVNAAANNLNSTRSSRGRGSWGGSNNGITITQNFGVNNNSIINDNFKIGGNMTFNHSSNNSETSSDRTSYLSGVTYNDASKTTSWGDKLDANMAVEMEWKIDTLRTLVVQPYINKSLSNSTSNKNYRYMTEGDSTSWGKSDNLSDSESLGGGVTVIYNKKSSVKLGRSYTARVRTGFSQNDNNSYNYSNKSTADPMLLAGYSDSIIDQYTDKRTNNFNTSVRLSFVEPLWNMKNMIEAAVSFQNNNTNSEKNQYDKDNTGDYTIFNKEYSNTFNNDFYRENIELNYRYSDDNYKIRVGLNAEPSQTRNYGEYGDGVIRDTTYGVVNFAPTSRIQYNFGKKQFLRFDYRGRTSQPSIDQMQPVKNNSDLMNESVGNSSLNPSFSHDLRFMYSTFNEKTFSSFNTYFNTSFTKDDMVSNKIYNESLKQYSQTVNLVDKTPINMRWNVMYNTPIIQKRLHFNTSTGVNYQTRYGYVSKGVDLDDIDIDNLVLGDLSRTRNYSASENLSLTFTHDVIELGFRGSVGYNNSKNNLSDRDETQVWNWSYRGNMVVRFPYSFTLSSDIAYSDMAGYSNFDQSELMWNASLDKTMFKNKATISLKAQDILRQRLNIRQIIGDNYVQYNNYSTVLPSYFLLSFTYKISKFTGMSNPKDDDQRRFEPGMRGEGRGEGRGGRGGGGGGRF